MWKYRLDFNLSYDELFVNIGFVFCTWEHYCKQYDEIWCIDGTWVLAQNGLDPCSKFHPPTPTPSHLEFSDFFRRFTYIYTNTRVGMGFYLEPILTIVKREFWPKILS